MPMRLLRKGIKVIFLNIGDPDIRHAPARHRCFPQLQRSRPGLRARQGFLELRPGRGRLLRRIQYPSPPPTTCHHHGRVGGHTLAFAAVADRAARSSSRNRSTRTTTAMLPLASIKIVPLTLSVENGIPAAPSSGDRGEDHAATRAILLCSPNNPTGLSIRRRNSTRRAIVKSGIFSLIGDESYKGFIYDGAVHKSVLEFSTSRTGRSSSTASPKGSAAAEPASAAPSPEPRRLSGRGSRFAQAGFARRAWSSGRAGRLSHGHGYFQPVKDEYSAGAMSCTRG